MPSNNGIPNNPHLPAIVIGGAVDHPSSYGVRTRIAANGWGGLWEWTVYDFHHYHPASHEALVCVAGQARLQLGGPEGPEIDVGPGDALILPAGFGHKRMSSTPDFAVVGAYPPGQESPEILRARDLGMDEAAARIAETALPVSDPLDGPDGPLMRLWRV